MFPHSEIREYKGAPALFIEGEPIFPLIFMTTGDGLSKMMTHGFVTSHLYTDEFSSGWIGINKYDYKEFEIKCQSFITLDHKALIFPRIILDPPEEWMNKNPGELIAYADPAAWEDKSWGGPRKASWASIKWKNDASLALRSLIRHIAKTPFAKHIIGWHIGAGVFGEWHYPNPMHYPDISPVFKKEFKLWLSQKYNNKNIVPRIPSIEERRNTSHGMFHHPLKDKWIIEHAEFFHFLGANALETFASVVKEETEGKCLVIAFNGYLPDLGTSHEADHSAFAINLRSKNIDVFTSPHSYRRRKLGEDASMRGFIGSVRVMGKLWINEGDDRTHKAKPSQYKHVNTASESVELLWRQFAQALTHNAGVWFMDQGALWDKHPEFYFYNDPSLIKTFNKMLPVAEKSMQKERRRPAEIAVVCDYKTAFYCADPSFGGNTIRNILYSETLAEIAKCGAPFDMYQITELFERNVPKYRLYILVDIFYMDDDIYKKFVSLSKTGAHILTFYAPAYLDSNGFREDRLRFFAGNNLKISSQPSKKDGHVPQFFISDKISDKNKKIVKNNNLWYCPLPPLDSNSLRQILNTAKVHIYMDNDDIVLAGGGYLAIHTASDGDKVIKLPFKMSWYNVRTEEFSQQPTSEIKFFARRGETLIWELN